MQTSRFELKYIISEQKARRIRDYVRSFLELDENCVGKSDFSYAVHSRYVDSDHLQTYWDTINGNKNRFKLRIRYYSDDPDTPAFLEIKRRFNNCIKKQRTVVRQEALPAILAGQLPPAHLLISQYPSQLPALQDFCRLVQNLKAKPKMHVAYLREAYVPLKENFVRVTMDRQVRSEFNPTLELSTKMRNPIPVWVQAVVLELKFVDRFPNWFRDLVRTFDLRQCGAAKYADGVSLLHARLPRHSPMPQSYPDLRWPPRNTRAPRQAGPPGIVAASGSVARAIEEPALGIAGDPGNLQTGEVS